MTKIKSALKDDQNSNPEQGITKISVSGYKSLAEECSIEIAPLTILSGANSAGKSSIMQPLLLMKQTLESTYDAGSLKLNGANVRLTSTDQIFTKNLNKSLHSNDSFTIALDLGKQKKIKNIFKRKNKIKGMQVHSSICKQEDISITLNLDMTHESILNAFPNDIREQYNNIYSEFGGDQNKLLVGNYRGFLYIDIVSLLLPSSNMASSANPFRLIYLLRSFGIDGLCLSMETQIRELIHVPGLRGNPERTYPVSSVSGEFTGTFENYVASIIHYWKTSKDKRLRLLGEALQILGLTWKVDTKQIDDTQVEVRVSRLKNKGNNQSTDMVSIADVGFGLSQTLPVVVALLVAEPEQLVYLEQPEIHLHPRAQANLAQLLVDAANRGVRVVVETHSELLIRRVQSLIAEDKIDADKVKLHWFSQDDNGFTKVTTAELDDTGAFGDWPEDFSEISLQEESRYLDAAESKLMAV
jgi:predicted ATPase